MRKIVLVFPVLLSLTGCAIQAHQFQTGVGAHPAPVAPASVKIYSGAVPPGTSYQILGSVAVDAMGDADAAASTLKEEAGKMGANAVVDVRLTKLNSFAQRTGLSGTAVLVK